MCIYEFVDSAGEYGFVLHEERRPEWSKVRDLLSAAMLMVNAWDECGLPNNATRERMAQALREFGK